MKIKYELQVALGETIARLETKINERADQGFVPCSNVHRSIHQAGSWVMVMIKERVVATPEEGEN